MNKLGVLYVVLCTSVLLSGCILKSGKICGVKGDWVEFTETEEAFLHAFLDEIEECVGLYTEELPRFFLAYDTCRDDGTCYFACSASKTGRCAGLRCSGRTIVLPRRYWWASLKHEYIHILLRDNGYGGDPGHTLAWAWQGECQWW